MSKLTVFVILSLFTTVASATTVSMFPVLLSLFPDNVSLYLANLGYSIGTFVPSEIHTLFVLKSIFFMFALPFVLFVLTLGIWLLNFS